MHRRAGRFNLVYPCFLGLALLMFSVPENSVGTLRASVCSLLCPLLRITSRANRTSDALPASINAAIDPKNPSVRSDPNARSVAAELDRANAEIARLRNAIAHGETFARPQEAAATDPAGVEADVIARRILWQEPILGLDKGSAEGVGKDAGVMHRGAVVGRIVEVGPHASTMALLTHRSMSIGARLAHCRVEGVLQGQKSSDTSERYCRLQIVAKDLKAAVGEHVVTSGLDGTFPAGLWLGEVVKINRSGDFQWELIVRPACDENRIEGVHVLTGEGPEVPWPAVPKK